MSTPAIIMWAVVFLVGVTAAWRNPTAAALVLCWIVGEVIFLFTGNSLPVEFYAYPDIFVLAVIMAKREYCNLRPYRSIFHQLACVLLERSPADRVIMLIFPLMWVLYVLPETTISAHDKWMSLWALVILQFLAAGAEALSLSLNRRRADAANRPPGDPGAQLVPVFGGGPGG